MTRGWMAAALALLVGASAAAPGAADEGVRATRLPAAEAPVLPAGPLSFRGGLILSCPDHRFGGWSGLEVAADGHGLVAVSDTGGWLRFQPMLDAAGRLVGVRDGRIFPMLGEGGGAISGSAADAESLRRAPAGGWLVSFERRHRVWRYPDLEDLGQAQPERVAIPAEVARLGANEGLESVAVLADGRLLLIEEGPDGDGGAVHAWLGRGDAFAPLSYMPAPKFRPTDAAALPGGDVIVVERAFSPFDGVRIRLVRVAAGDLRPGAVLQGEELARLQPPGGVDNFEGLAVVGAEGGETLLYLISDDNFSSAQRTLLFLFELR